jgi:hypothetical protein
MLKFAALSLAQKRFVMAVLEAHPQYKKKPEITLKECASIYYVLRDQRTGAKGEKIGYPNWLFAANKVERGLYQLPVPTVAEVSAFNKEVADKAAPVAKAKAKVAKLAKAKTVKVKSTPAAKAAEKETKTDLNRLQKVIDESMAYDDETEDFNQILRENGIEV